MIEFNCNKDMERVDFLETIMKAVQLMENKQSDKALKLLKGYLPSATAELKYAIADVYVEWGFLHEAMGVLEDLLKAHPNESEIKLMLADIYIELEDDKAAISLLDNIEEDDPLYNEVLIQLADLYQSEGLFEVAEMKLLQAKKVNPNEPIIDFALGEFFFSIGEYKRSIIYYENMLPEIKELAEISIEARLAEAYAACGEYESALEMYQAIDSNDPDTLFKFGFTAYHAKRNDIAINTWKKVIELDEYYHSAYYELAKAYQEEGLIKEAYETSSAGLKLDEYNKELYFLTGLLAHQLGENEESEELIRKAIELDFDYKDALLFLIELLKEKEKHDDIISLIVDAKLNGAEDGLYDWELARAYNEIEAYPEAHKFYTQALITLKEDSVFLKEYGYFLTEEGKINEAIPTLENYLAIEPSDTEVMEHIERLKFSNESE